jgi:hypothetical protein
MPVLYAEYAKKYLTIFCIKFNFVGKFHLTKALPFYEER